MIQLEERLYTSTEVAEVLGVSLRSVYRYLEEGKLDAEIKTATGRHRFSKKNILDFLYPDGSSKPRVIDDESLGASSVKKSSNNEIERNSAQKTQEKPVHVYRDPIMTDPVVPDQPVNESVSEDIQEEPVDWLAKFREAAKKFREESEAPMPVGTETPLGEEPVSEEPVRRESFSGFTTPRTEPVRETAATKILYYRSSLGGLKDIAQNIDKTSRSSGVPYAFSMNAGLSLYKPIKPFSVLHAYVKPQDLPFFERVLSLTPSEETGAQLCLYVSSDTGIFANREEMHGLFVVSKTKLLDDIAKVGDESLVEEAKSVL